MFLNRFNDLLAQMFAMRVLPARIMRVVFGHELQTDHNSL